MSTAPNALLDGLSEEESRLVMELGEPAAHPAGTVLFHTGADADRLYLLKSGRIDLSLPMRIRDREEDILLEEKRPGEIFGWSGLVPPHRFTLKALAPVASELLTFPRTKLLAHFAKHPTVGLAVTRNVAAVIGHRLQVFQTLWLREMQRAVEQRVAS